MAVNIKKFKADIDRLNAKGTALEFGLTIHAFGKDKARIAWSDAGMSGQDVDKMFEISASFRSDYQPWYTETLALIRQVLPDRVADFVIHYEVPKGRKELNYGSYVILDALLGRQVKGRKIAL